MTGTPLGWRGAWGTTYATNLRLYMEGVTEDEWVEMAKAMETRPPMPWFAMRAMAEEGLRALHAFITSLGPAGVSEPAYLPPDKQPDPPFVQFPWGQVSWNGSGRTARGERLVQRDTALASGGLT